MADEKISNREICRYNKYRRRLLPKLHAKLCEINEWWRSNYPLYDDLICHISNVSSIMLKGYNMLGKGYSTTIALHDSRGLFYYRYKMHGGTIAESVNNFANDYKKILEITKNINTEMMQNLRAEAIKRILNGGNQNA